MEEEVKLKDMTKEELIDFAVDHYKLNKKGLESMEAKKVFEIVSEAHTFMTNK